MAKTKISLNPDEFIWAQKYRPKTVDDIILPKSVIKNLKSQIKKGEIQNYIFSGNAGIGKTTTALAIANDLGCELLQINASSENGIDTIRNKVVDFASTVSFDGGIKLVLLDEADNLSRQAQMVLRGVLEEFSKNTRFILTCNYKNQLIDALHSRCQSIDFNINDREELKSIMGEVGKRILNIFNIENIQYEETKETKLIIYEIIKNQFPDIRSILVTFQNMCESGTFEPENGTSEIKSLMNELIDLIKGAEYGKIRKWVGENADVDSITLFRYLYDNLYDLVDDETLPNLILVIAQYQFWDASVVDKEINKMACITEILKSCRFM